MECLSNKPRREGCCSDQRGSVWNFGCVSKVPSAGFPDGLGVTDVIHLCSISECLRQETGTKWAVDYNPGTLKRDETALTSSDGNKSDGMQVLLNE